jgi:hypothetical protein
LPISYISRTGQIETITFVCGITEPVTNAQARETIQEIKQRAPAQYYTQNRMVNGEDYNNFPFTAIHQYFKKHRIESCQHRHQSLSRSMLMAQENIPAPTFLPATAHCMNPTTCTQL